ncbi:MAG: ChrR family anti-sigma-E factor [Pseudomonadota bacterium]
MERTKHHPTEEQLTAFAAGSLPLSQALCISTHLEHCPHCLQKLQRLNQVGSELMQQLKPAPTSDRLKDKLMNQLDSLDNETPAEQPARKNPAIPRCLQQFIEDDYSDLNWKRVSADIESIELCRDSNGAKVELLKIKPGGSATTHTHLGDEYTVILEGSFSDEDGLYHRGDFLVQTPDKHHTPVATLDRECICLAVTEGPIQFTGWFARFFNPLIRRSYAWPQ